MVLLDRNEARMVDTAALACDRMETLVIDPLRADLCRRLGEIWCDEPLDVLVHLQALRDPQKIAPAITAIAGLTRDLARALRAARGRVLTVFAAPSNLATVDHALYDRALGGVPDALQSRLGSHGVRANALRLPGPTADAISDSDLVELALFLCSEAGGAVGGAVLPIWPRSH